MVTQGNEYNDMENYFLDMLLDDDDDDNMDEEEMEEESNQQWLCFHAFQLYVLSLIIG